MNNLEIINKTSDNKPKEFSKLYVKYLIKLLSKLNHEDIAYCIDRFENCRKNSQTIFVAGNGGSASTASHIGNDFGLSVIKSVNIDEKPYKVHTLVDNISVISAISNDSDYSNVFRSIKNPL